MSLHSFVIISCIKTIMPDSHRGLPSQRPTERDRMSVPGQWAGAARTRKTTPRGAVPRPAPLGCGTLAV